MPSPHSSPSLSAAARRSGLVLTASHTIRRLAHKIFHSSFLVPAPRNAPPPSPYTLKLIAAFPPSGSEARHAIILAAPELPPMHALRDQEPRLAASPASSVLSPGAALPLQQRQSSTESRAHGRKGIHKVSRACDYCKAKKTRCSGTIPCTSCTRRRVTCMYEAKYFRGRPPTPPLGPTAAASSAVGDAGSGSVGGDATPAGMR